MRLKISNSRAVSRKGRWCIGAVTCIVAVFVLTYTDALDWVTGGEKTGKAEGADQSQWRSSSRVGTVPGGGSVMTSKRAYQMALSILTSEMNRKDQWVCYPEKNRKAYEDMEKLLSTMGEEYARKLYLKYYAKDPSKDKIPLLVTALVNNVLTYLARSDLGETLSWLSSEGFDISGKKRGCYRIRYAVTMGVIKNDPVKALDFWDGVNGLENPKVYGWGYSNAFMRVYAYAALAETDFPRAIELVENEVGTNKVHAYRGIIEKMPESQLAGFAPTFETLHCTSAKTITRYEAVLGLWLERKLALRWLHSDPDAAITWFSKRNPQESMVILHGEYPDLREGRMQHLLYAWGVNHPEELKTWALTQERDNLYAAAKALGERNYDKALGLAQVAKTDAERMKIAKHALQRMVTKLTKYDELYHMFRQDLVSETWWTVRKKIKQSNLSEGEKKVLLDEVELHFEHDD